MKTLRKKLRIIIGRDLIEVVIDFDKKSIHLFSTGNELRFMNVNIQRESHTQQRSSHKRGYYFFNIRKNLNTTIKIINLTLNIQKKINSNN